jgi:hypothetical protein
MPSRAALAPMSPVCHSRVVTGAAPLARPRRAHSAPPCTRTASACIRRQLAWALHRAPPAHTCRHLRAQPSRPHSCVSACSCPRARACLHVPALCSCDACRLLCSPVLLACAAPLARAHPARQRRAARARTPASAEPPRHEPASLRSWARVTPDL